MTRLALQRDLLVSTATPALDDLSAPAVRHRPGHWLLLGDDGRMGHRAADAQLAMAGGLLAATPQLYAQTHVAVNTDEVRWTRALFPAARSDLGVYRRFGLPGLGGEIGTLAPGRVADLVVRDRSARPVEAHRQSVARDLQDAMFAWPSLADERHVASTRVAGVERFRRGHALQTPADVSADPC